MAVVIFFRVTGDSDRLVEGYEQTVAPPHPSRLAHVCARTPTGMAVTEVWTSQEDLEEFMRTDLPPIMERAGMPGRMEEPPTWEICEIHNVAFYAPSERPDSSSQPAGAATI
jgi:hypothetical protein